MKKTQHNKKEDLISHSADQPQDRDYVQSQFILRKSTSSKSKTPTTVTLGDSIVKNVHGNLITKSVKHQKHVVVKHFSGAETTRRITSGNYNSCRCK